MMMSRRSNTEATAKATAKAGPGPGLSPVVQVGVHGGPRLSWAQGPARWPRLSASCYWPALAQA
eukprot:159375-Rhodomonas_salina.1